MCGVIEGVMAGGAILSAIGNVKGGYDQRNAARQAAKDGMQAAEDEAADKLQRAAKDAGAIAARGAEVAATQVAIMGASNVSGGTTVAPIRESMINAGQDEAQVKANAVREAWSGKAQARRQANALTKQGDAAVVNGWLGAVGGVASAGGQIATYSERPSYKKDGA